MDETARALLLMKLAQRMFDVCEDMVTTEAAWVAGRVSFSERAELRAKALAGAQSIVDEVTKEHCDAEPANQNRD